MYSEFQAPSESQLVALDMGFVQWQSEERMISLMAAAGNCSWMMGCAAVSATLTT